MKLKLAIALALAAMSAQAADQFIRLAAEHRTANYFNETVCMTHTFSYPLPASPNTMNLNRIWERCP